MSTQHPCTTNNILCQYSQQSIHNLNLSTFTCLISSTTDTQRILFFWEIHQINLVSTSLTIWPNSISKGSVFYHKICVHMHVLVHVSFDPWNNGSYVCFLFLPKHIHWICNLPFTKRVYILIGLMQCMCYKL